MCRPAGCGADRSRSAGPIYLPKDVNRALKPTTGLKWGSSKRFHNTELGPQHAGPFISQVHSEQEGAGSDSPGPAHYTLPYGDEYDPARGHKFPTTVRMNLKKGADQQDWVPGPGAYQVPTAPIPHSCGLPPHLHNSWLRMYVRVCM